MSCRYQDYPRVLLKVSGGSFASSSKSIDRAALDRVVGLISPLIARNIKVAITTGGGNILRGAREESLGMQRSILDAMGMLGTVINAIALAESIRQGGFDSQPYSAVHMKHDWVKPWDIQDILAFMEAGGVPVLAGGTGLPYFSTDTGAVLMALRVGAGLMIKASRVDGVYDSDPEKDPRARLLPNLTYAQAMSLNLEPLDQAAFALARENGLDMVVLNLGSEGVLKRWFDGEKLGTLLKCQEQ